MENKDELLRRISNIERLLEERKTKPLNLVEAAKYLSISQSHLYKLTSQRKIPSHKPNGKYLYFTSEKSKGKGEKEETQDVETEDEEPP
jgi:excisionase family DNA binding protein